MRRKGAPRGATAQKDIGKNIEKLHSFVLDVSIGDVVHPARERTRGTESLEQGTQAITQLAGTSTISNGVISAGILDAQGTGSAGRISETKGRVCIEDLYNHIKGTSRAYQNG
jgi:hypothetical protein